MKFHMEPIGLQYQIHILKFFQDNRTPFLTCFFLLLCKSIDIHSVLFIGGLLYWCINKYYGFNFFFSFYLSRMINGFLKAVFKEQRPIGIYGLTPPPDVTAGGYSFPSGHAQLSSTMWTSLMTSLRKKWMYFLGVFMILGVGTARLYLGVHWPQDVITGWIVGIILVLSCNKFLQHIYTTKRYQNFLYIIVPFFIMAFCLGMKNTGKPYGALIGFIIGFVLEEKYLNFTTNISIPKKILRFLLSYSSTLLMLALVATLGHKSEYMDFIKYFVLGIYVTYIAPLLFTAFNV